MTTSTSAMLPPVVPGKFLIGSTADIRRDLMEFVVKNNRTFGDIFEAKTAIMKLIFVHKPEWIKYILVDNHKNYHKSFGYEVLKLFLGEGLLTSEGDFWLRQRRLAAPAFHRKKLEALSVVMGEEAEALANRLEVHRKSGRPADIAPEMMQATMLIAARTLMGADVSANFKQISNGINKLNEFAMWRITHPILPMWFPTLKNFQFRKIKKELNGVLMGIISDRRKNPSDREDLLAMLMNARDEDTGEMMNDGQLRDEIVTLFIAGHETTAVGMSWLWYLLAKNPQAMENLRDELSRVLAGRTPTFADLPHLPYSRMVIDETLRLYPPAWVVGRKPLTDDEVGGYKLSAGANVLMLPYIVHRNPDLWSDPEKFIPERFAPGEDEKRHRFAYFPFGGGPRICIGNQFAIMEMQILLATLAQRFRPEYAGTTNGQIDALITLRPKNGMVMRLK